MKLFMSGREFKIARQDPPMVQRAKKLLDTLKNGELFSSAMLVDALGVHQTSLKAYNRFMTEYTAGGSRGKMRYYGNPATIKELKRQLAKEGK